MHIKFVCVHCKRQVVTHDNVYELRGDESWACSYCGKITKVKLEPMR